MSAKKFVLIIGSRTTSSWSLRPWLVLRRCNVELDEEVIKLRQPDTKQILRERSPSGLVPFLKHGDRVVWDSLSISEYLAEQFPGAHLWPAEPYARAIARSVSAEMHSGFGTMRQAMPVDFLSTVDGFTADASIEADIKRIRQIWSETLAQFGGGPFLFGRWSIADAMFAPVVARFRTYRIDLTGSVADYVHAVCDDSHWKLWEENCRAELQVTQ